MGNLKNDTAIIHKLDYVRKKEKLNGFTVMWIFAGPGIKICVRGELRENVRSWRGLLAVGRVET